MITEWCFPSSCARRPSAAVAPDSRRRRLARLTRAGLIATALALTGCSSDYPNLADIATTPDSSAPLEVRRQIVRDLLDDRDQARHRQGVVRYRSGLLDVKPPAAPIATAPMAEDIVGAATAPGELADEERKSAADRAFEGRAEFDDGTLNDFIRDMKRDTEPLIVEGLGEAADGTTKEATSDEANDATEDDATGADGASDENADEDALETQSWQFQPERAPAWAIELWRESDHHGPLMASLVPAFVTWERAGGLQLIDNHEEESGFFCTYLGWMVAWSDACPQLQAPSAADTAAPPADDSQAQAARPTAPAPVEAPAPSPSPDDDLDQEPPPPGETVGEENSLGEDIDSSGTSVVSGPFDRLRDLIRSRARRSDPNASDPRSLSYEAEALKPPEDQGPLLPSPRPAVEQDFRMVRQERVFEFNRTPIPAFKPIPPPARTESQGAGANKRVTETALKEAPKTTGSPDPPLRKATEPPPPSPPIETSRAETSREDPPAISAPAPANPARADTRAGAGDIERPLDDAPATTAPAQARPDHAPTARPAEPSVASRSEAPAPPAVVPAAPEQPPGRPDLIDVEMITFAEGSAELPLGSRARLDAILRRAVAEDSKIFIISDAGLGFEAGRSNLAMERARSVGLALVRQGAAAKQIEYDIVTETNRDQVRLELRRGDNRPATADTSGFSD